MPPTLQLPDLRRTLADLERRLQILERRIRASAPDSVDSEIIFSLSGTVIASSSSKAFVRTGGRLVKVVCSLVTAGTTTTTVQIKKNGSTVVTVNLGSGVTLDETIANVEFGKDSDALSITVSAAGSGAAGLTVQTRFSATR